MAEIIKKRPVYIGVLKYKYPAMAIASVFHRISGVAIFLFLPFMLYLFHGSLVSQNSFLAIVEYMHHPVVKFIIWVMLASVLFHLIAGIRHLLMDLGIAESYNAGKMTAILVFVLFGILVVLTGVWLIW